MRELTQLVCLTCIVAAACGQEEPIRVGHHHQLFVDDHIIARRDNIGLSLHNPTKCPLNPVLQAEHPWESKGVAIYGTAMYDEDEGMFKMWYRAIDDTCYVCYATSADGFTWQKPILNVMPHRGSTANNIVWGSHSFYIDGFAVYKDPREEDPARLYKMLTYKGHRGFAAMVSPDGIHWSGPVNDPAAHDTGDVISMYYDSGLGKYVALLKRRFVYQDPDGAEKRKRARLVSFSDDFTHWSEPQFSLVPDEQDPASTEFYSHVAFMYEGMRIGYISNFLVETERIDSQLCYSRDGHKWERYRERIPFLPNGPEGTLDAGMLIPGASDLIVRDGRLWIYYFGANVDHAGRMYGDELKYGIGLARLRLDGFVSADADADGGTLTTKAIVCSGRTLRVNVDAPRGEVRAELLDEAGEPIEGYDLACCLPYTGDSISAPLMWHGRGTEGLIDRPVRIRFDLKNAQLYSFWFAEE